MRIEQRAYALWQAEGQPDGKHEEHWRRAAREIEAEETAGTAVTRTSQRRPDEVQRIRRAARHGERKRRGHSAFRRNAELARFL